MKYKVTTHAYGGGIAETAETVCFKTHTEASEYLADMIENMESMGHYVRFSNYHEWTRRYRGYHRLNINSFHVQMRNGRELDASLSEDVNN